MKMKKLLILSSLASLILIAGCHTPTNPSSEKNKAIKALGITMIYILPGEFIMGSDKWNSDEKPAHKVRISQPFWIGECEITQSQYQEIMNASPSLYIGKESPVEQISWEDAAEFCKRLNEIEKKEGRVPAGYIYRLPTEAEWEYACRAGTVDDYPGKPDDISWNGSNSENSTQDVGTKSPNPWGIHDMNGNVWEWCLDSCGYGETGVSTDAYKDGITDPFSSKGDFKILRGGSWCFDVKFCRTTKRYADKADFSTADIGMRIVLAPEIK